jgi:hypothetical protein
MPASVKPLSAYLETIGRAEELVSRTWAPDDPLLAADLNDQIFNNIVQGYFLYFGSDRNNPDFTPVYNSILRLQPNPDDTYVRTAVDGGGVYRLSGERGTCRLLTITLGANVIGTTESPGGQTAEYDLDETVDFAPDGTFDVVLSSERPEGCTGNWLRMPPDTDSIIVRRRSYDWLNERDPRLAIERLDVDPMRARPDAATVEGRLTALSEYAERHSRQWLLYQDQLRQRGVVNRIEHHGFQALGGIRVQTYWWGIFEIGPDEALILETDVPEQPRYWNVQLNDQIWNTLEFVWRQSSLNGHQAKLDSDGRFRAVISGTDPGVPNWLDTVGRQQGTIVGRWYRCSTNPVPTLTKVKLAEVRDCLPPDTPFVTQDERSRSIRDRARGAQMRIRW